MTDDEIKRLRKSCDDAPPRVDGRRVSLDPKTVLALLDEVERLKIQEYRDRQVSALVNTQTEQLERRCSEVERMRPVFEAAKAWRRDRKYAERFERRIDDPYLSALADAVDAALVTEAKLVESTR